MDDRELREHFIEMARNPGRERAGISDGDCAYLCELRDALRVIRLLALENQELRCDVRERDIAARERRETESFPATRDFLAAHGPSTD